MRTGEWATGNSVALFEIGNWVVLGLGPRESGARLILTCPGVHLMSLGSLEA